MLSSRYHTLKTTPSTSRRDLVKQNFYVHHPLLEQIIEAKLEKCLKYGQLREKNNFLCQNINRANSVRVIEAPCIMGNQKRI
jgi:hypothetical protein